MSSQPGSGSRLDRRKQETRARILEAAVELFGEVGFDATKISDLCERADVARQTFFNHFPAKSDLLAELYRVGEDWISTTLDSAFERGASTRDRLRLFFTDSITAAIEVGPANRDLVAHVVHSRPDPDRAQQLQHIFALFQGFVRRCLAGGDVTRRHPPEVLAQLLQGALGALMIDWGERGGFDPKRRAAELAALVADAFEIRPEER
ncbi:MAG TPA: TetR/AcrR family transcriptional regulator [Myxococcota bacterium]|nr:TetR/AcrR family transcriptional regulator [Myxococcota bacterium]